MTTSTTTAVLSAVPAVAKSAKSPAKSFTVSLTDSARAIVTFATNGERIVYSRYVADSGVTLDTVGEHVAALAALAVEMKATDSDGVTLLADDKDALKRFKNKIRNGLNTHLGKVVPSKQDDDAPVNLLTAKGVDTLAERIAAIPVEELATLNATTDLIHDLLAEIERRAKQD